MGISFKKTSNASATNSSNRTFKLLTRENIKFLIEQGFKIKNQK